MKTLAIVLATFVLVAGAAVPMTLAQDSSAQTSPPSQPSASPPAPADKGPSVNINAPKPPDAKVDVDVKSRTDRGDDAAGAASPRTGGPERTGFFGLSPTAAIIVSIAVLLVVILAIVAMTNNRGTTYVDRDRL